MGEKFNQKYQNIFEKKPKKRKAELEVKMDRKVHLYVRSHLLRREIR